MHTFAYKLNLDPMLRFPAELTAGSLAEHLAKDAVIREFGTYPDGSSIVRVELQRDRDSHEEALNELLLAVQKVGYSFAKAEITKIADRAIEMAIRGGVGGLGAGSTTKNREIAAYSAVVGWFAGLFVGANMTKVEVIYRAQRTSTGWDFIRVAPQPAAARPALQAG